VARPQPVVVGPSDRDQAFAAQEEIGRLFDEVEDLAASDDCSGVCETVERICSLSDRICTISERHPEDREIAGRCTDGRSRCDEARARGNHVCHCSTGP
jgi:hypothetical protein